MGVAWKSCIGKSSAFYSAGKKTKLHTNNVLSYPPVSAAALIGQAACGLFVTLLGKHKLQTVISVTFLTIFAGAMAATTQSTPTMAVAFIFLASISLGYVETVALTIGPFCLKQEDLGLALGLLGATRSTLATTAQAIFSAILNNKLLTNIPKYVIPAAVDAGLPESSTTALLDGLAAGNFSAVPDIMPAIIAATNGRKQGGLLPKLQDCVSVSNCLWRLRHYCGC